MPEFVLGDRTRSLESIKFLDLISGTESDDTPQLFARLLGILGVSLRHASSLRDHVNKHADIREQDQADHPERFAPAGDVMTAEQIAENYNEQPEPHDEHEYREDVDKKVCTSETSIEEHRYLLFSRSLVLIECDQFIRLQRHRILHFG